MTHLKYFVSVIVLLSIFALPSFAPGQTPKSVPTKPGLPQVPITYPGDTDQAIIRRAQWITEAKKEGELVWWGQRKKDEALAIINEFNKVYPFIKVEFWQGTATEVSSKIEAEYIAKRYTVDVLLGGQPENIPRWRANGMLGRFTDIAPGIDRLDKRMYSRYDDWIILGSVIAIPSYNTKLVPAAEAPKNWEDLLNPKWKGQIGMPADFKTWTTLAVAEGGWGVEKTEDFLRRLKQQNPIYGAANTATHALLKSGEFKIDANDYLHNILNSQEKKAPVAWIKASPAVVIGVQFNLLKNAPNPNAAKLFLEWMTSPQGMLLWDKITGQGAPFPGSKTRMANLLKGVPLCVSTEEAVQKIVDMGLVERYGKVLGIAP